MTENNSVVSSSPAAQAATQTQTLTIAHSHGEYEHYARIHHESVRGFVDLEDGYYCQFADGSVMQMDAYRTWATEDEWEEYRPDLDIVEDAPQKCAICGSLDLHHFHQSVGSPDIYQQ